MATWYIVPMAISCILWQLVILYLWPLAVFYGNLVYCAYGHLVIWLQFGIYFPLFGLCIVSRKIWQPWCVALSLEDRRMFVALAYFLFRKESLSDVFLGTRHAEI
jgi:hypothetical protein